MHARRPLAAHRILRGLATSCLAVLAACASEGIRLSNAPAHPQDFNGHWVVDPSRSEDPDAQAAAGGGGGRGMGGGHGHGGGGGMGGMGGGGMGGGGMAGMGGGHGGGGKGGPGNSDNGGNLRRAQLLPDTLDIAMHPGTLTITPDGHPRSMPMVSGQDADPDTTRAGWDGDSLVVIIHVGDKRADIVQHYVVAPDHSRLVVTTEFKGTSKTISVVREFTPATVPG